MFDIFVKRKKIVIDFFTTNEDAYAFGKSVPAIKVMPKWFHETQEDKHSAGKTIRKCPGIVNAYTSSIAMTSWFNAEIEVEPDGDIKVKTAVVGQHNPTNRTKIDPDFVKPVSYTSHPTSQYSKFVENTHGRNFKLNSPWWIKCKQNIKLFFSEPTWHNFETYDTLNVMPGIIETRYNRTPNLNYITRPSKTETKYAFFEPGDPLVVMTPLTEDNVEIHNHFVTESEARAYNLCPSTFGINLRPDSDETTIRKYGRKYSDRVVDKLRKLHGDE